MTNDNISVLVYKAPDKECVRCGFHKPSTDLDILFSNICYRCASVLHCWYYDVAHGIMKESEIDSLRGGPGDNVRGPKPSNLDHDNVFRDEILFINYFGRKEWHFMTWKEIQEKTRNCGGVDLEYDDKVWSERWKALEAIDSGVEPQQYVDNNPNISSMTIMDSQGKNVTYEKS